MSGAFPVSAEGARKVGFAIAEILKRNKPAPLVAVGRDTRKCGAGLQDEICRGLTGAGARVVCAGICPTPAVVSLIIESGADAGIMVSASHNPPEYNGFKVFNSDGLKIPQEAEAEIESEFEKPGDLPPPRNGEENGLWKTVYGDALGGSAPEGRDFSGIKIALDCANGAMSEIAPEIFEKTGAALYTIGCEPDGDNINSGCGSLQPAALGREVRRRGAAFGAALDGDGDRVSFCCENGREVDGDKIIALFAAAMVENKTLKQPSVAATVMSNKGLEIFLENMGLKMVRTAVGDRNVADAMKKEGLNFGGEKSGHLIFSDYSTGGDGLLAALLMADMVKEKNKPLSLILPEFDLFPQVLKNVRVRERKSFDSMPGLRGLVAAREKKLGRAGRIHIRYSGTEPLARVLVEGEDESAVNSAAEEIAETIKRAEGAP